MNFPKHTSKYPCTYTSFFHGLPDSATSENIKFLQKMLVVLFKSVCLLPGITFAFCKSGHYSMSLNSTTQFSFVVSLFVGLLEVTDLGQMAIAKATSITNKNPTLYVVHV